MLVNVDVKGLEVGVAAELSQDPVLCQEVKDKVDMYKVVIKSDCWRGGDYNGWNSVSYHDLFFKTKTAAEKYREEYNIKNAKKYPKTEALNPSPVDFAS